MENHGLIIRELRHLKGWSVQFTSKRINRSVGWISAIENNNGNCRLTEAEFNRIVTALDGDTHKSMFRTWVANYKNRERTERSFDGAVLKFIRRKKEINLKEASKLTAISVSYLSELETGEKPISLDMRNQIMRAYGYSPSSFKNLSTDPIRSKVVPSLYKIKILIRELNEDEIRELMVIIQQKFNLKSR